MDRSFDGDSINANTVQNNSMYGGSAFNSIDARSYTSQKQILAIGSLKLPQTYDPSLENQKMTEAVKHELEEKKEKERKLAERELRENTVYPGEVTEEPDQNEESKEGVSPKKSNWLEKIRQEQLEREKRAQLEKEQRV